MSTPELNTTDLNTTGLNTTDLNTTGLNTTGLNTLDRRVSVAISRLPHSAGLDLPAYATIGAAGMDLLAAVAGRLVVMPIQRVLVPTGLAIALPPGYELQIRPRSGLALKNGIVLPNSPGTIDEDYRGEIQIILLNASDQPFTIERGMRIAQAVLAPVVRIAWQEVAELPPTARGQGGFGSTGTS